MASKLAHDRFRKRGLGTSHSPYGVPRFLNLNRKVFLSHSGGDKDFVWFLHEQLCSRYHDAIAFFDDVTLPKAEPVSMKNILEEAKGSELGVLVLSEDFFMRTPNPMRELVEFTTSGVRLLPLFFKISVAEFKDGSRRARWQKQWKKWAAGDKRVVNAWKCALNFVNTFAGLEYHKVATNHCDYVHEIVKAVTRIIRPAISFSDEGVHGKDRLCKIVEGMYKTCTLKRTSNDGTQAAFSSSTSSDGREHSHHAVDVVGVYGFAGLGKTTLCKCLCDNYFNEFNGKVCHVDLGSRLSDQASSQTHSSKASFRRMEYILAMLTDYINDGQRFQFSQVQNLLREHFSSMTDPVFLAIDNILPEWESQMEAGFYLSLKFPKGSKIFLTSRSCGILENLTSQFSSFSVEIDHIPGLELQEARDIFVHELPEVHDSGVLNVQDEVNDLVNMCCIHFQDLRGYQWALAQYHPLMLKSLAASIRWKRTRNLDWKGRLAKLRSEGIVEKNDVWKTVFNVLDISFALLREEEKKLFLDLLLFYSATHNAYQIQEWVESVYSHLHKQEIEEIFLQLHDLFFIRRRSRPPDLLVDYAKYTALQTKRTGINAHYLVVDGEPCPESILGHVRYLSISKCVNARMLDLRNVQGLEVLHLVDNAGLQEVFLSRTTSTYLRSVIVRVPPCISLRWTMDDDLSMSAVDRQRSTAVGPRWAQLQGNVILATLRRRSWRASIVLSPFLRLLAITAVPVLDLGCLGNLLNLECLDLSDLPYVQAIDVTTYAKLEYLYISNCKGLQMLTIPNRRLNSLIRSCASLERVSLYTTLSYPEVGCNSHGSFYTSMCPTLGKIDGLHQYAGKVDCYGADGAANIEETFGDLVESAGIDKSICKAKLAFLRLSGSSPGLAGAECICVEDAEHIGLLIAALFMRPECHLHGLRISCKKGGDCGCDKNAPSFGPVRSRNDWGDQPHLKYCCPQVRDLSSVAQWDVLEELNLSGCSSVEVWPDFATMTSLRVLNLSYTSLKEWPAGVLLLQHLLWLDLRGCWQLAAEELIKVIALEQDIELSTCKKFALGTLMVDLEAGVRERWAVMDALDSQCHELWQCGGFDSWQCNVEVLAFIIALLYDLWFDEGCGAASDCCEGSPSIIVVQKMRRLLCSAFFMQLLPLHLLSHVKQGFKDPYMAFALMGIAVVGAASGGLHNAAVNESLKDSIISFLKSCRQDEYAGGEGSSSTMLQQDHLYFEIHWPADRFYAYPTLFRRLSSCPHLLGTKVPKLWERVGEGVRRMARAADQVGPHLIQGLEATLLSRNFLQYDVKWLLSSYIKHSEESYLEDDILRAYYNLLGRSTFQSFCEWEPGLAKDGTYM